MKRIILEEKNFNKLKEIVKKNKENELIFMSNNDELNRKVIEKIEISGLLIPLGERKDYMKQRNSGFNEVMAKICAKKGIFLAVNLDELINSNKKEELISRLKQNIMLCKKKKVKIKLIQLKEKRDLNSVKSLGLVLGIPTSMIKEFN